jgi:putative alpha-1,2-mannosidase
MKRKSLLLLFVCLTLLAHAVKVSVKNAVDFVNPLVGSDSNPELSTGNTYPAIAMPWGMNFWVPQTGKMGDGWQYTYSAKKIRGLKQTHQPSPWKRCFRSLRCLSRFSIRARSTLLWNGLVI